MKSAGETASISRRKPADGEPMDARQQAALAPLQPVAGVGGEEAAQDAALGLELQQRAVDRRLRQAEPLRQRGGGRRTDRVHPAAHDGEKRRLRIELGLAVGEGERQQRRFDAGAGIRHADHRGAFRGGEVTAVG